MQGLDDINLLREYVERGSEDAFATLVARHVNKVYSVAWRHTGNSHQAREITQVVFVILARKARRLRRGTSLAGWLYQTARVTALTFIRSEIRRARREQEAFMQTSSNEIGSEIAPQIVSLLDVAMAGLNDADRLAIVLRFFDGKSMREVGRALGASEDAAKMRVSRATEKLRTFFLRRGVTVSAGVLTAVISAHSVQAAPAALTSATTIAALAHGTAASSASLNLVQGVLKAMAWTKAKTAIVIAAGVLLIGGAGTSLVILPQLKKPGGGSRTDFPRSSWAFAGYTNPASTLETFFWAQSQGDGKTYLASVTPELRQQLQQRFSRELAGQRTSLEDFFAGRSKEHVGAVTAFHILREETIANQVLLRVWIPGKDVHATFKMEKVGNDWKLAEQFLPDY